MHFFLILYFFNYFKIFSQIISFFPTQTSQITKLAKIKFGIGNQQRKKTEKSLLRKLHELKFLTKVSQNALSSSNHNTINSRVVLKTCKGMQLLVYPDVVHIVIAELLDWQRLQRPQSLKIKCQL